MDQCMDREWMGQTPMRFTGLDDSPMVCEPHFEWPMAQADYRFALTKSINQAILVYVKIKWITPRVSSRYYWDAVGEMTSSILSKSTGNNSLWFHFFQCLFIALNRTLLSKHTLISWENSKILLNHFYGNITRELTNAESVSLKTII